MSAAPEITDGYTFIYNRISSALIDDGVIEDTLRVQFAKKITDAIWALHLSVDVHSSESLTDYNNFSNTKLMVNSIISNINLNNK